MVAVARRYTYSLSHRRGLREHPWYSRCLNILMRALQETRAVGTLPLAVRRSWHVCDWTGHSRACVPARSSNCWAHHARDSLTSRVAMDGRSGERCTHNRRSKSAKDSSSMAMYSASESMLYCVVHVYMPCHARQYPSGGAVLLEGYSHTLHQMANSLGPSATGPNPPLQHRTVRSDGYERTLPSSSRAAGASVTALSRTRYGVNRFFAHFTCKKTPFTCVDE